MNQQHPIDQFVKSRVAHHTIAPSNAVWEKIAAANKKQAVTTYPLWIAASLLLLLSISITTFWLTSADAVYQPRGIDGLAVESGTGDNDGVSIVARIQNFRDAKLQQAIPAPKVTPIEIASAPVDIASVEVVAEPIEMLSLENEIDLEKELKTIIVLNMPELTERLTPPNRVRKETLPQDLLANAPDSASSPGFRLLDYSLEQLNNVVHGNKIAAPKNSKELLPEPIELAYDRVTSFFRSNKNN